MSANRGSRKPAYLHPGTGSTRGSGPSLFYLPGYQATRAARVLRVELSSIAPIASHTKAARRTAVSL